MAIQRKTKNRSLVLFPKYLETKQVGERFVCSPPCPHLAEHGFACCPPLEVEPELANIGDELAHGQDVRRVDEALRIIQTKSVEDDQSVPLRDDLIVTEVMERNADRLRGNFSSDIFGCTTVLQRALHERVRARCLSGKTVRVVAGGISQTEQPNIANNSQKVKPLL